MTINPSGRDVPGVARPGPGRRPSATGREGHGKGQRHQQEPGDEGRDLHHSAGMNLTMLSRSLAIATHTFFTLVFRWRPEPSSKLPLLIVASIWIALALIIGISFATHRHKIYYGDTQYCMYFLYISCVLTSSFAVP